MIRTTSKNYCSARRCRFAHGVTLASRLGLLVLLLVKPVLAAPLVTYSSYGVRSAIGPDALSCLGASLNDPCSNASQTLTYDVNGSVILSQDRGGVTNYQYNHDNKLLRSTTSNHAVENIYGPHGERVATIEDGSTTFFFGNGLEVGAQGKTQSYFFGGERIAMKDQGRDPRFFFGDHLGSVRAVTDSHGTVLTRSDYYPFGEAMRQSGISSFDSNYKFNGNRTDPTGIYDYNARSMNPAVARFLQPDSIIPDEKDPQSLNRYAYVQNNPLRFRDPTGHSIMDIAAKLLTSAGASSTATTQTVQPIPSNPNDGIVIESPNRTWERMQSVMADKYALNEAAENAHANAEMLLAGLHGVGGYQYKDARNLDIQEGPSINVPGGGSGVILNAHKVLEELHPGEQFRGEKESTSRHPADRLENGIKAPGENLDPEAHIRGSCLKQISDTGLISSSSRAATGLAYTFGKGMLYVIRATATGVAVRDLRGVQDPAAESLTPRAIAPSDILAAYRFSASPNGGTLTPMRFHYKD